MIFRKFGLTGGKDNERNIKGFGNAQELQEF